MILTFNLDPVAKGRPRFRVFNGIPIAYTPKATRDFEDALKVIAKTQLPKGFKPYTEPLSVKLWVYIAKPKSVKRQLPSVKPDLDNYIKILDAFNGLLWTDDSLIVEIYARKLYDKPKLIVEIGLYQETL